MLKPGDKIPPITLQNDEGQMTSLADYAGCKLVLYFYPRDNTPACTNEAVSFEMVRTELAELGYTIIGISGDSVKSHVNFKDKHGLRFTLMSDPEKTAAMAFGAWGEKTMYGKKIMGIIRSTFLVDDRGIVTRVYPRVVAAGHGTEVLDDIRKTEDNIE